MKWITLAARILMGLIFVASGISFFFVTPPPMEGPIAEFFKGMAATGYFFYLLKVTEIVCGALLLSGLFVPLALVVLAPIILNIFMIHVTIAWAPSSFVIALFLGACEIWLAFFSKEYSPRVKALFKAR